MNGLLWGKTELWNSEYKIENRKLLMLKYWLSLYDILAALAAL